MGTSTIILAALAMAALAAADFSVKQASGRISSSLGTLIYALSAFVIPLAWTLWSRAHEGIDATPRGVAWSIGTGLCFSVFTGLLFLVFATGASLSVAVPAIRMGGIAVATALGLIVLGEQLSVQHVAGIALAAIGVSLVLTA